MVPLHMIWSVIGPIGFCEPLVLYGFYATRYEYINVQM